MNILWTKLMFSNTLQMVEIDQNMSHLWQIVRKKYNFSISVLIGFIVRIFINTQTRITLRSECLILAGNQKSVL